MKKYSKYTIGQKLVVKSPIDGFLKGEIVKVVKNEKKKKRNYYSILVQGVNHKNAKYIRTDYVKPVK